MGVGPGPPAPKEGKDSVTKAAAAQWLGLRGAFPEPQTALHSPGATCPAETRSHYSQLLLTLLRTLLSTSLTPTLFPRVAKGEPAHLPASLPRSLAPILLAHRHLSHWDKDPETLARSTLTAVTQNSVPRNRLPGGMVTGQRTFRSQGWKGPPSSSAVFPVEA